MNRNDNQLNFMKSTKNTRFSLLLAMLLLTTFAKAQINVYEYGKLTKTYLPAPLPIDRQQLIAKLNENIKEVYAMYRQGGAIGRANWKGLTALDNRFERKNGTLFYYKDIITDSITSIHHWESGVFNVPIEIHGDDQSFFFLFKEYEYAQQFAENIFYLVWQPAREQQEKEQKKELTEFQGAAKTYNELKEKPAVTEEQRKYIVQANAMSEKKEYNKAIDLYSKAIEISPVAYPAAYYNLALLYAQTNDFRQAIFNMKKYLLLMPDAPDARAAQDKIYEWEFEVEKRYKP